MKKSLLTLLFLAIVAVCSSQSISLINPKNGWVSASLVQQFSWNSGGYSSFRLQVARDPGFTDIVSDVVVATTSTSVNLPQRGDYYWRVAPTATNIWSGASFLQLFAPTDIPDVSFWYASDSVTAGAGGKVTVVPDLSGAATDAVQPDTSLAPILIPSAINGKPSLYFDGVNDHLLVNSPVQFSTIFIVTNYTGGPTFPDFVGLVTGQNSHELLLGNQGTTRFYSGIYPPSNISVNNVAGNEFAPLDQVKIVVGNGGVNMPDMIIGRYQNYAARVWKGYITEVIGYKNSLTPQQIASVSGYLRFKYARQVDLGADINIPYRLCDTLSVDAGTGLTNIDWFNGDTTQVTEVSNANTQFVSVSATDLFGYTTVDTVELITASNKLMFQDFTLCLGDTVQFNPGLSAYQYSWSTGSTAPTIEIFAAGEYSLTVTDTFGCSKSSDTLNVAGDNFINLVSLGNDTTVCSGATIALSTGGPLVVDYLWSTGDTTEFITVTSSGNYSVRMENSNGCIARDTIAVSISGTAAVPNFTTGLLCDEEAVSFFDASVPPSGAVVTNWQWIFPGPDTSTVQNPQFLFPSTGTFNVTLQVMTDQGCVSSTVIPVTVDPKPVAAFDNLNICEGSPAFFINRSSVSTGSISEYFWNFGMPGNADTSTLASPSAIYLADGLFQVTLMIRTDKGCRDTVVKNVIVNDKPIAEFATANPCKGNVTVFFDDSEIRFPHTIIPGSIKWSISNGITSVQPNPAITFSDTGNYSVTYMFTASNGCRDTVTRPIHIYTKPTINTVIPSLCEETAYAITTNATAPDDLVTTYQWTLNNGLISTTETANLFFNNPGVSTLGLNVITSNKCSTDTSYSLTVNPKPVAAFLMSRTLGNPPALITFTNTSTGSTSSNWDFGDGTFSSVFSPQKTFQTTGVFPVTLIVGNSFGCTDTAFGSFTSIPELWDVAVNNVFYTVSDTFVTVTAEFINLSNADVSSLDLILDVQNGGQIKDKLPVVMPYKGSSYVHTFSSFRLDERLSKFCVTASGPNGKADEKPENNVLCRSILAEGQQINLFPNPVSELIRVDVYSGTDTELSYQLFDSRGRAVSALKTENIQAGLDNFAFDASTLNKGLYFFRATLNEKTITLKVIKVDP